MMHMLKDWLLDILRTLFPERPSDEALIGFGAEQERNLLRWMVRDCKKHPGEELVDLDDGRYECSVCRYEYEKARKAQEEDEYTGSVPAVNPLANIPAAKYVRVQRAPIAAEKTQGLSLTKEQRERLREVL